MKKLIISVWHHKQYSPHKGLIDEYYTGTLSLDLEDCEKRSKPLEDIWGNTREEVIDKLKELAKNKHFLGEKIKIKTLG